MEIEVDILLMVHCYGRPQLYLHIQIIENHHSLVLTKSFRPVRHSLQQSPLAMSHNFVLYI